MSSKFQVVNLYIVWILVSKTLTTFILIISVPLLGAILHYLYDFAFECLDDGGDYTVTNYEVGVVYYVITMVILLNRLSIITLWTKESGCNNILECMYNCVYSILFMCNFLILLFQKNFSQKWLNFCRVEFLSHL